MKLDNLKIALIICLFLLPSITFAKDSKDVNLGAPVSLELRSVSVSELSRMIFSDMLHSSYFVSPDVLSDDRKVSISVTGLNKPKMLETVSTALASIGVEVTQKNGVYFIGKIKSIDDGQQSPVFFQPQLNPMLPPLDLDGQPFEQVETTLQTYIPKNRPILYLSKIAKFAGAKVADVAGEGGALVYSVPKDKQERLAAVLAVADSLPASVTIKAALIEYTDSSDDGYSLALDVLTKNLGVSYKAGGLLANSFTLKGATIQAVLSAISGDSRFSYMARPLLHVVDGEKATISVGSDVPVRGAVSSDKLGNPVQAIDYRQSGVVLTVQPRITADTVALNIDQQVSSFGQTTTSNIDSPTLLKRAVSTVVNVKRGQLVVLAGLDDDKATETHSGLSWLPSSLRSKSSSKAKSQILLMLEVGEEI